MWPFHKSKPVSLLPVWGVAIAVLLIKCAWVFATSIRGIASTTWLIDDSFIEMQVARNLALGNGFSLDGIHPTTGAPFLWIYASSITHLLFGMDGAIRATLILTAIFGALCSMLVFVMTEKLTEDRRAAWTAFLLSLFTANAFVNGLMGMDVTMFTLFVLATAAAALDIGRPKGWNALQWGCVTGLMAGLACMTRGDGLFILFAIAAYGAWRWWTEPKMRKEHTQHLMALLGVWAVCFAIFMTWQLAQTGSPFPGNQVGRRGLSLAWHNFSFDQFNLMQYLKIVGWNVFQLEELMTVAVGGSIVGIIALIAGACFKQLKNLAFITVLYIGSFFALLVAYQWYFADVHGLRYVNPAAHLLFIFMGWFLWQLPTGNWKKSAVIAITVWLAVFASYKHYQMMSRLPWHKYMSYFGTPDPAMNAEFWATLDWMNANLPSDTIVGIRDYGRAAVFGDVRVQDIAGNIDPEAAAALRNGTLDTYLKDKNVTYLLIPTVETRSDVLYRYLHEHLTLDLVKEAPQGPSANLYRIRW